MKKVFSQGTVVPTSWFNAIQDIKFDLNPGDEPFDGSYEKLTNDSLSNTPGNIVYDYYNHIDQFKVTVSSGLVVRSNAGLLTDRNGYQVAYSSRTVTVPANRTSYVSLNPFGNLVVGDDLIYLNLPLAKITSNATSITLLTDIRPFYRLQPTPAVTKVIGGTGDEGAFVSTGNHTFDKGVYFFDSFILHAGHTITCRDFTKIYCADNFIVNGNIIIEPTISGGGNTLTGTYASLNLGRFPGNGVGGGGGETRENRYNWQLSPVGSGGSSGLVTASGAAIGQTTDIASGGYGGGGIQIECASIIAINGTIRANGGNGSSPVINPGNNSVSSGSGGGSGGTIILMCADKINVNSTAILEAKGGVGGNGRRGTGATANTTGGGGGGGGQIVMIAPNTVVSPSATTNVSGGLQGTNHAGEYNRSGADSIGAGDGGGNGGNGGSGSGNSIASVHNGSPGLITIRQFKPVG